MMGYWKMDAQGRYQWVEMVFTKSNGGSVSNGGG